MQKSDWLQESFSVLGTFFVCSLEFLISTCDNYCSLQENLLYEVVAPKKCTTVDTFEVSSDVNRVTYAELKSHSKCELPSLMIIVMNVFTLYLKLHRIENPAIFQLN